MHLSSLDKMRGFRERYLEDRRGEALRILDIGSQNIYGSYRDIFARGSWQYVGVDVCAGENVDLVLADPYNWTEVASSSTDVIVSGQAFEHIEYFWITMTEIARVLKPGGLCCLIAPSAGKEHRYPVDCWRFYADGFRAMAKYVGFEVKEATTQWESQGYSDDSDLWADSMLVAEKPMTGGPMPAAGHNLDGILRQRLIDAEQQLQARNAELARIKSSFWWRFLKGLL